MLPARIVGWRSPGGDLPARFWNVRRIWVYDRGGTRSTLTLRGLSLYRKLPWERLSHPLTSSCLLPGTVLPPLQLPVICQTRRVVFTALPRTASLPCIARRLPGRPHL